MLYGWSWILFIIFVSLGNSTWLPSQIRFLIGWKSEISNIFSETNQIYMRWNCYMVGMFLIWPYNKFVFILVIKNPPLYKILTSDLLVNWKDILFSDIRTFIEPKLYMNNHWMVLFKVFVSNLNIVLRNA